MQQFLNKISQQKDKKKYKEFLENLPDMINSSNLDIMMEMLNDDYQKGLFKGNTHVEELLKDYNPTYAPDKSTGSSKFVIT